MSAKILLLDPPHKIHGAIRMWTPSPGLMAIAAYLESNGQSVDFIDATTFERPWTDLSRRLKEGGYDIIGVTCPAVTFHFDAIHAVRLARMTLPDSVIIGGGGHFTLHAELLLIDLPELDYIVMGEGEKTFLELIKWLDSNGQSQPCDIPGVMYMENNQTMATPSRPFIPDLDELPIPGYNKIDLDHPTYNLHGMGLRTVGISTSRGCGDHCSYCSESALWHSRWRGRSGQLVVNEMEMLNKNYGKSLFVFNENSFNQSRKRNEAFLESLGHSGLKCDFWFQSRLKDILRDRDLLSDFKRLGCYEIMLGVESISPETLRNYSKKQTLEQAREATALLKSHGIIAMTNVMFGDINDTEETLKHVYDFVSKNGQFLVLTITTPLPGTRYYQHAFKDGRIEENEFSRYDFMHPIMSNKAYSKEQILSLQKKYLKKYYTRPVIFFKMLFSPNKFIRMAYRLIMRYAWYEARNIEWVQENFEETPEKLLSPVQ